MLLSHLGMISAQTLTTLRSLVASEAAENAFVNAELTVKGFARKRSWKNGGNEPYEAKVKAFA